MKKKMGKAEIIVPVIACIIACIFIGLFIYMFFSPKVVLIVTPQYNEETSKDKNVLQAFDNSTLENDFKTYFWWYNTLHETGHMLKAANGDSIKITGAEEEQWANDFAYAYWSRYGEEDRLSDLERIVNYATEHVKNDDNYTGDYMEYAKKNWNNPKFNTFNNYGYFQFNSVKESIKNKRELEDVLKDIGITNVTLNDNELVYDELTTDTCNKIVIDAINNIHEWGLKFPEMYHKYSIDPFESYSRYTTKGFYGFYTLTDGNLRDK